MSFPTSTTKAPITKPKLTVGDRVWAVWWDIDDVDEKGQYYPGVVEAVYEGNEPDHGYGALYLYDIDYDDGDYLPGLEDCYVFPENDYLLSRRNKGKPNWIGVKNVYDTDSKDLFAKYVGWWEATIGGEVQSFALLSEALRAYDVFVVSSNEKKGIQTKPDELNIPQEWNEE